MHSCSIKQAAARNKSAPAMPEFPSKLSLNTDIAKADIATMRNVDIALMLRLRPMFVAVATILLESCLKFMCNISRKSVPIVKEKHTAFTKPTLTPF